MQSLRVPLGLAVNRQDVTLSVGPFEVEASLWDGGTRQNVLLLHGLGGNAVTWHGVAPLLAAGLGARVLAPNLPGFGASRVGRHALSVPRLLDVSMGLLDARCGGPAAEWTVAGNSLGGILALGMACRAPRRITRVVLAATALPLLWGRGPRQLAALTDFLPLTLPWLGRSLIARHALRTGVPGLVDDPVRALFARPERLRSDLREELLAVSEYRLGWASEAARAYEQTTRSLALELCLPSSTQRALRNARCPVQVIYGDRDPLFAEPAWQRLRRERPDWHYAPLRDVGHVPQLEEPELFAEHMLTWLREQRSEEPAVRDP